MSSIQPGDVVRVGEQRPAAVLLDLFLIPHGSASGIMNAAMMPMWIVSGVFFSAQRFPGFIQPAIKALHRRYRTSAARSRTKPPFATI